jgi:hypothetical protein
MKMMISTKRGRARQVAAAQEQRWQDSLRATVWQLDDLRSELSRTTEGLVEAAAADRKAKASS